MQAKTYINILIFIAVILLITIPSKNRDEIKICKAISNHDFSRFSTANDNRFYRIQNKKCCHYALENNEVIFTCH